MDKEEWQKKAHHVKMKDCPKHDWMPISWKKSEAAKHVSMIMCKCCFHTLNISEVYSNRE